MDAKGREREREKTHLQADSSEQSTRLGVGEDGCWGSESSLDGSSSSYRSSGSRNRASDGHVSSFGESLDGFLRVENDDEVGDVLEMKG